MDFIIDALLDSVKLLPFLLVAYIAIEVIEYFSAQGIEHSRFLSGKFSTLYGAGFGLIPQCGFSVVATDLYSSHKIKIGTLLAVYIATSDEAIPLILMNPNKIIWLIPLLLIKFILAVLVGYSVDLILKKFNAKHLGLNTKKQKEETAKKESELMNIEQTNSETHEEYNNNEEHHIHGCCGHDIEEENKMSKARRFFVHPLIHTLKIFAFILFVNVALNGIIKLVGEENLMKFLRSSKGFAPLFAGLIGLIPNCASSVVLTSIFASGGISFGALISGLIVNAGIAFVYLFKQNKSIKQNLLILLTMLTIGLSTGYIIQLIGF